MQEYKQFIPIELVWKYEIGEHELYCAPNSPSAIELINKFYFDLAFVDYNLPNDKNKNGAEVGKILYKLHLEKQGRKIHQVMLTAQADKQRETLQTRVFFDYLTKNYDYKAFAETMDIFSVFYDDLKELKKENDELKSELRDVKNKLLNTFDKNAIQSVNADTRFESLDRNIIGKTPEIQRVKYFIKKYSETEDNVLIVGETGTGKDLVAEAIHKLSKRGNNIFKTINCAAIPDELIESTLFGVIKDYPGFHNNEKELIGVFEESNGGTVFLDEIDRMSLKGQTKLLRLLEDHKVIKLGETDKQERVVDVRIIAAIKPGAVNKIGKEFLEDLYGRLQSIFPVIPTLKERKDDIPLLVNYFIDLIGYNVRRLHLENNNQKASKSQYPFSKYLSDVQNRKIFMFDEPGLQLICEYEWKRNVRELRKFIENIFSIFVNDKTTFNNQIINADDVHTAFIFKNTEIPISDEDRKMLDDKFSTIINDKKPPIIEYERIPEDERKEIENKLKLVNAAISLNGKYINKLNQILENCKVINNDKSLLQQFGIKQYEEGIGGNANSFIGWIFFNKPNEVASIIRHRELEFQNIIDYLKYYKEEISPKF